KAGNVYVAWHGVEAGGPSGEQNRRVWLAGSVDEGKTFAEEIPVNTQPTGACGCCSMRAFADGAGSLHMLYRSAKDSRDINLLASKDKGKSWQGAVVHAWKIQTCPMSTMAFAEGPGGVVAAWDTEGQIYFTRIRPG